MQFSESDHQRFLSLGPMEYWAQFAARSAGVSRDEIAGVAIGVGGNSYATLRDGRRVEIWRV